MDRRDVAMVNQSFDRLGDSLLRDRMLKQQDRHFDAGQAQRDRQFDASLDERKHEFDVTSAEASRRTDVDEKNADTMALYRKAMAKNQQAQQSVEQLRKVIGDITAQHKSGQITTAEANRRVKMLQDNMRRGTDFIISEAGLADINFQDVPAKPAGRGPAGLELDRAAAELEKQASMETDKAAQQILLERAKKLRSGIGREDPTQYVDETEVIERDEDGKPLRTRRRKVRADQVTAAPAPAAAAASEPNPKPGEVKTITSQADYESLAAGQQYRDPQGNVRVKGGAAAKALSPTAEAAAPTQAAAAAAPEPVISDEDFERKLVAIRAHPQKDVNNAWRSIAKDLQRLSPISSGHNSEFLNIGSSSFEHSPESAYYKAITNGDFRGLTVQNVSEFMKRLPPEERGRIYYRALKAAGAL